MDIAKYRKIDTYKGIDSISFYFDILNLRRDIKFIDRQRKRKMEKKKNRQRKRYKARENDRKIEKKIERKIQVERKKNRWEERCTQIIV